MLLQFAQTALTYTVPFLLVLTLVITIHELGHFLVARLCGVAVDRFSIGFGRAILSWRTKSGMEWRIGWIPLGGYVKFSGDENAASVPDADDLAELKRAVLEAEGPAALKRYFHFKPLWQRVLVVLAGPVANFILAIAIYAGTAMTFGEPHLKPVVGAVAPGSPAAKAGFLPNDLILRANGGAVDDFDDIQRLVVLRTGEAIRFDVQRAGTIVQLTATPARMTAATASRFKGIPVGVGYLGLQSRTRASDGYVAHYSPLGAVELGARRTMSIVGLTITYIERIVTGRENGDMLTGPIGIAGGTGQAAADATKGAPDLATGALALTLTLLSMSALISAAVGFANLLPIPVLDGGHLLFYAYEAVARRPLSATVQAAGYRVGFAVLIGLMLFVTWNDLQRFRVFHLIGGLFS
jgi:regulator of sigma E protease